MDVDSEVAFFFCTDFGINDVVFVVVSVDFYRAPLLSKGVILAAMLSDLVNAAVLAWYENGGTTHVTRVLKPINTWLRSALPCSGDPPLLIPKDNAHTIIKAVGLVVLASNADDVQVVLTLFKYGMPKRINMI